MIIIEPISIMFNFKWLNLKFIENKKKNLNETIKIKPALKYKVLTLVHTIYDFDEIWCKGFVVRSNPQWHKEN